MNEECQSDVLMTQAVALKKSNEFWMIVNVVLIFVNLFLSYAVSIILLKLLLLGFVFIYVILLINHWKIRNRAIMIIAQINEVERRMKEEGFYDKDRYSV